MSAGGLAVFAREVAEIEKAFAGMPEVPPECLESLTDTKQALEDMAGAEFALMAHIARFEEWRHGEQCPGDGASLCTCGLTGLRIAILNARMALTTMEGRFTTMMQLLRRLRG